MVQGKYALEDAYGAVPFMLRSINPKGSWLEVSSVLSLRVFMKLESHLRAKMHH
jgi:hypothetical protein